MGGGGGGIVPASFDIMLCFAKALSWPLQDLPATNLDATPGGDPEGPHGWPQDLCPTACGAWLASNSKTESSRTS